MAENETNVVEASQRESLFDVLRQALKSRGITYAMLADSLNVSELTIKRLFAERDCKLSRLLQLCQAAGIGFNELVEMQERRRQVASYLPLAIEEALAKRPPLFNFLVLLISRIDTAQANDQMGLSEISYYRYLRELEKLDIIAIGANNQFRYKVPLPVRWRLNGPLAKLIVTANAKYVQHALGYEPHSDYSLAVSSRLMTAQSAQTIKQSLQELQQQFDYLATQDQLFYKADELELHKLLGVMGPFPIAQLFPQEELSSRHHNIKEDKSLHL